MAHQIGNETFHIWQGGPPPKQNLHFESFRRSGFSGTQVQQLGNWGEPQTVTLSSYHESFTAANNKAKFYEESGPSANPVTVVYDGEDWGQYVVTGAKINDIQAMRVCGPDFNYPNGARVDVTFEITPI